MADNKKTDIKGVDRKEWLTPESAAEYVEKAKRLPDTGGQDVGARRKLRIELQQRSGLTEVEAINILNGHHISDYIIKYCMQKEGKKVEKDPKKNKNLINLENLEELDRLRALVKDDYGIPK